MSADVRVRDDAMTDDRIARVEAFQISWRPDDPPGRRTAMVRVTTESGLRGHGEASPMMGGEHSLLVVRDFADALRGQSVLDHAVICDRLLHRYVKLGPEGAVTGALAALDIALWDLKGKLLGQPIWALLGGAWRQELPFYSSVGNNATRTVEETVRAVEARWQVEQPAAIKIRWDGDRTGRMSISPAISRRRRPCADWWATISRSPSTPTTATRSAARSASAACWRISAISGSKSRFSTIMSVPWARLRGTWTSRCPRGSRPTRSRRWSI
jgi:L-alanine-DL-glutamate epimerase-like enolase superfamily enzyme